MHTRARTSRAGGQFCGESFLICDGAVSSDARADLRSSRAPRRIAAVPDGLALCAAAVTATTVAGIGEVASTPVEWRGLPGDDIGDRASELGGQGNLGLAALDARDGGDELEDSVEIVVGPSDDAAQQVADTGDGVDFGDLVDVAQRRDGDVMGALGDFQGGERGDIEPGTGRIDVGSVADDDTPALEAATASLDGAPRFVEEPGQFGHRRSGVLAECSEEPAVQTVELWAGNRHGVHQSCARASDCNAE
jgi:hypothetical protein